MNAIRVIRQKRKMACFQGDFKASLPKGEHSLFDFDGDGDPEPRNENVFELRSSSDTIQLHNKSRLKMVTKEDIAVHGINVKNHVPLGVRCFQSCTKRNDDKREGR